LIVDDHEDSRILLKKTLESDGYSVEVAPNGLEALYSARNTPPDMIISDILMPEMDGFRLCREVKRDERLKKIPFVFYTATFLDPRDEKLAICLGASRFIVKPMETTMFLEIVKEVLQEYMEGTLKIPEEPLECDTELLRFYEERVGRKLDEKLQELNLYKQVFQSANDAIAIFNPDGRYIEQNFSHRLLIGYPDDELQSKSLSSIIGEKEFKDIIKGLSERGFYRGEFLCTKKTGEKINVELSVFSVRNEKGEVMCHVGINRDITERKKMESELRERIEELEKFYEIAVGREIRMKELKEEVKRLKSRISYERKE
jgi:PAS domain S-box-containing protein